MNIKRDGCKTPTDGCRALAAAVILNGIEAYANCILREKKENISDNERYLIVKEKKDCERFFTSELYLLYAGLADLNIPGHEILRRIKREPRRFVNRITKVRDYR